MAFRSADLVELHNVPRDNGRRSAVKVCDAEHIGGAAFRVAVEARRAQRLGCAGVLGGQGHDGGGAGQDGGDE